MEMTYGGALVMPSSYAMMDEEEMMYVEGGADIKKKIVDFILEYALHLILDVIVKTVVEAAKYMWNNKETIWKEFLRQLPPNERTKQSQYYKTFHNCLSQ